MIYPDFLCHYYEAAVGPFVNLSDLPLKEAEEHMVRIRQSGNIFASKRSDDYVVIRRELEDRVRALFEKKGGRPARQRPHYMVVGSCPWLLDWYVEGRELRIPLAAFASEHVSFTYGDTFPAMRYGDGKPYRKQVYVLEELPGLIQQFGLPQDWNQDGKRGPDRYIEAQIWSDEPLRPYYSGTSGLMIQ